MRKNQINYHYGKLQMLIDRYMAGSFWPLFGWSFFICAVIFLIFWGLFSLWGVNWSLGDAFIQMSNPSSSGYGVFDVPTSEWIAIIITNLFGLFVLNGVILTLLVNWVSNRKDSFENGEARYKHIFQRKFCVIIGGHRIVASLVADLLADKENEYIIIQTKRDPRELRREIIAEVKDKKALANVVIYSGDRTSLHELEELHLANAREIYIIGESSHIDKTSHDAINMQTWKIMVSNFNAERITKIPCHVMFDYQSTLSAFQFTDVPDSNTFRFIPFSFYENWAQQLLLGNTTNECEKYLPLDGNEGIPYDSPQRVHLIVVGMSKMGMAVATEAAHIAHYPNFNNPAVGNPRTLITFIDREAKREMMFFMGRNKELLKLARWRFVDAPENLFPDFEDNWNIYDSSDEITNKTNRAFPWNDPLKDDKLNSPYSEALLGENLIDTDFEFIQGDISWPSIQKYMADSCNDKNSKTTIAICLPIDPEAISAALYLPDSVYNNVQQIWVQQGVSGALADTIRKGLTGKDASKFNVLLPFGMIEQCDYMVRIHSLLPKLVNFAYKCISNNTTLKEVYDKETDKDKFFDDVENCWLQVSNDGGKSAIAQRWSNIYCANTFPTKLRTLRIDYKPDGTITDTVALEQLANVEHNRWIIEQLLLGFRPVDRNYKGDLPVENKDEKIRLKSKNIHHDILANNKLKEAQKKYDKAIAEIIPFASFLAQTIR